MWCVCYLSKRQIEWATCCVTGCHKLADSSSIFCHQGKLWLRSLTSPWANSSKSALRRKSIQVLKWVNSTGWEEEMLASSKNVRSKAHWTHSSRQCPHTWCCSQIVLRGCMFTHVLLYTFCNYGNGLHVGEGTAPLHPMGSATVKVHSTY